MGKIWGPDAVAKNASTAFYGNISAISESPKRDGLLFVGTDDGLIQVHDDEGAAWRKADLSALPEHIYVQRVLASQHDENVAYAALDNHQNGDFKPYLMKTTDRGKTWTNISAGLPQNGPVMSIAEDFVNPKLLFAGTEYGLYFSIDGGDKWTRLRGGLPTIEVRDMVIQKRESDLVLATFGRGFYVLDDYSPLRTVDQRKRQACRDLSRARRVALHSILTVRRQRQSSSWRRFLHRRKSADGRDDHLLRERRSANQKSRSAKPKRETPRKTARNSAIRPSKNFAPKKKQEAPQLIFTIYRFLRRVIRKLTAPAGHRHAPHELGFALRADSLFLSAMHKAAAEAHSSAAAAYRARSSCPENIK